MSLAATLKQGLKIKTGSLKRLSKEHKSYAQEVIDHKAKLDKSIKENGEEWDIKNARNLVIESEKMTAHVQKAVLRTYNELKEAVEVADADESIAENDPDLIAAKATLDSVTIPQGEE
ncbi:tubulin binding cofactor A-domain-containing protein [Cantharellus anzutake]|uniref:tubulin binding cofactor A-domain-containing protein n=1 Tax=Cantharellus anzutake TaxID=1750568 RepID=UPI0019053112|nr:tubulin binding cofactor A-domain-containing protein [Cantharellus anzutake]KAF8335053.1 tubulin binding cofactor A-domain-containing protein [Cantharellus anzutake]